MKKRQCNVWFFGAGATATRVAAEAYTVAYLNCACIGTQNFVIGEPDTLTASIDRVNILCNKDQKVMVYHIRGRLVKEQFEV